jgi:ribosomal protein L11 methylase PrmA
MAGDVCNNLQPGGWAILSGFIDEQVDWVKNEYEKCGMNVIKIINYENWYAILMEKTK